MEKEILLIIVGCLFLCYSIYLKYFKEKYSHTWRKKSANKVLEKIKHFDSPQVFAYLRKVEPFIVEELILSALDQREEIKIQRNKRYTGDNGIDGKFVLKNKEVNIKFIVQVKRYSSYINPKHLKEFANQIHEENAYLGFFIHTGKTSKNSFAFAKSINNLEIISGQRLIKLIRFGAID